MARLTRSPTFHAPSIAMSVSGKRGMKPATWLAVPMTWVRKRCANRLLSRLSSSKRIRVAGAVLVEPHERRPSARRVTVEAGLAQAHIASGFPAQCAYVVNACERVASLGVGRYAHRGRG